MQPVVNTYSVLDISLVRFIPCFPGGTASDHDGIVHARPATRPGPFDRSPCSPEAASRTEMNRVASANAPFFSARRDQRQLDEARLAGRVVDALHGLSIIARLGPENIGNERLRIAIVEREPARLNLYHDPMAWQEDVVRRRQVETVHERHV